MPGQSLKRGVGRGGTDDTADRKARARSRRARLVLDLLGRQGAEQLAGNAFLAELARLAAPPAATRERTRPGEISSLLAKLTTMPARSRPTGAHPAGTDAVPAAARTGDISPRTGPALPADSRHCPAFNPRHVDPLNDHPTVVALTLAAMPRAAAVEILHSLPGRRARLILRRMKALPAVPPGEGHAPAGHLQPDPVTPAGHAKTNPKQS